MRLAILAVGTLLAGAVIGQPAGAAVYTSSAAFTAATSSLTIENYGAYAAGAAISDGSTLGALTYVFNTGANLGGVVTNLYNSFTGNSLAAKQAPGPLVTGSYTIYDTLTFDFIGVTTSTPFTSATFTSSNFNIPEIAYGVGAVPELSSWAMMILGFSLVGLRLRRRGAALSATA